MEHISGPLMRLMDEITNSYETEGDSMERNHDLLKRISDMIEGRAAEVLPQLCERIEDTRGEIPQKVTIDVAYKPPKDDDSMARIEVSAKLSAKTTLSTALAKVEIGDAGNQLALWG